jgi:hypothetical protein
MMTRRAVLGSPFTLAATGYGLPAGGGLAFRVMRKGSQIGTHTLTFRRTGTTLEIGIDVNLAIGFGPFTLFRYRMLGTETWRDDQFAELHTTTDNDGEALRVSATREPNRVVIESSSIGRQILAADTLPLNHWNIANMSAPLFNPQSGRPMQLTGKSLGPTQVALASGVAVPATRYALTGEATIDDWYDGSNVWTALQSVAKDGSIVTYQRLG